jgi:hypothetical protein
MSASNRACLLVPLNLDPEIAFVVPIEEFLRSGCKTVPPRHSVEEYCNLMRLNHVIACHLAGKRKWALYNLDKARNTSMFWKKRMLLRAVVCFPPIVIKTAMKLKNRAGLNDWMRGLQVI